MIIKMMCDTKESTVNNSNNSKIKSECERPSVHDVMNMSDSVCVCEKEVLKQIMSTMRSSHKEAAS